MTESKPFASLSSSLLARKGQAKPAMRPQAYGAMTAHDDLGWNDMGHPPARTHAPEPVPVKQPIAQPVQAEPVQAEPVQAEPVQAETVPPVVTQRAAIAKGLGAKEAPRTKAPKSRAADVVPIARGKGGLSARGKSAFTLRLDPDRHLKLRLACAVEHRSAQQLVTQALDELLAAMPDVDALADRVPARGKH